MTSVLAIDQGTTGSTVMVISESGDVLSRSYQEFTQFFPQPGWVEHDPEEIWRVTCEAAGAALEHARDKPKAIGITNQRETIVAWDRRSGRPLGRAIVWQDRRTTDRCRDYRKEYGDRFISERTGLVWDPYFSATKIQWMLEHEPGLRELAEAGHAAFGTIDSWLVFRLTSGRSFVTDHTNASRTLLYNINSREWDPDLLEIFGIPEVCLPTIRRSSEVVGTADARPLALSIPVAGMAGDQQAALFGQACWESGQAKCTYGTGAFLLMNVGLVRDLKVGESGVLTTVACDASGGPVYALEGAIFIAGAAIQWLRDGLGLLKQAAETEMLAESVDDTGGVYFVPALVGLGAPHWEAKARGTIVGLTRGSSRAHLVRAALESMAFSTKDVVGAMERASSVRLAELKVDGGAAANNWLMQFQSDVLGVRVARPDLVETTALGAAGLAGLAVGVWPNAAAFSESRRYRCFEPSGPRDDAYREWRRAVATTLHWAQWE